MRNELIGGSNKNYMFFNSILLKLDAQSKKKITTTFFTKHHINNNKNTNKHSQTKSLQHFINNIHYQKVFSSIMMPKHSNNNNNNNTSARISMSTISFAISSMILSLSDHMILQPCYAFHLKINNQRTFLFPSSSSSSHKRYMNKSWKVRSFNNGGGGGGGGDLAFKRSFHSSTNLLKLFDSPDEDAGSGAATNNNNNSESNKNGNISPQMKQMLEDEIEMEMKQNSSTIQTFQQQKQKQQPINDTIAINTIGTAISPHNKEVSSEKSKAASEQILIIDPSSIEVVPFNGLAQEGQVLGGAFSSPSYDKTDSRIDSLYNYTTTNDGGSSSSSSSSSSQREKREVNQNVKKIQKPNPMNSFVNMFRGSANYIANHRNTVVVYHIPGDLLEWDGFADLMDDIALTWLLGMKPVIVVGCRMQIDGRLNTGQCSLTSLSPDGKSVECIEDGRLRYDSVRITDFETLRVVKEEAGFVRYEVERQLGRALHLHGTVDHTACTDGNVVSGNFFTAQPYGVIDGVDFKFTGYPRRFEVKKIQQVLDSRDVLLLTPLGSSPSGEIFNVNTEHLAASVAGALKASKVIFFTKSGTAFREKKSNKLVQNFRLSDAKNLLKYNSIVLDNYKGFTSIEHEADLKPEVVEAFLKTGWSIAALEKGVKRAHIIAPTNGALLQELYTRDGSGTLISRDIYEGFRNANVNDVAGIYELIQPFVATGYLVSRPKNVLEKDIDSYYVFTRDNLIVACAQLKMFENGYAEIGCMVVKKEYRSQGRGDAMLSFLERLGVICGCPNVFVLSTQTMEWFVEHGYTEVGVEELPPSRRTVYNYERMSKIYMKKISNIRDLDAAELWWNR